jgi:uncharacterized membrane protein YbaN (DUF454 family)
MFQRFFAELILAITCLAAGAVFMMLGLVAFALYVIIKLALSQKYRDRFDEWLDNNLFFKSFVYFMNGLENFTETAVLYWRLN